MKITVYVLATNYDGSLDTLCFATEREMLAEVWTNIELHCGAKFPKIKAQFGDDVDKAYDEAVHEYNMTLDMNWSANEIDVPDQNPSIVADMLDHGAAADIWYDAEAHGDVDVGWLIVATQTAMTDAAKALRTMVGPAPARVAITVEGGLVQLVNSDTPDAVKVFLIDFDNPNESGGDDWKRFKVDAVAASHLDRLDAALAKLGEQP